MLCNFYKIWRNRSSGRGGGYDTRLTEYDILMTEKEEEFKLYLLGDEYSYDSLLEMCEEYIEGKKTKEGVASVLWFLIEYEMWLNKSGCWPIQHNPEWAKWAKLKEKKVKKKEK
jgi:hypothetical protein